MAATAHKRQRASQHITDRAIVQSTARERRKVSGGGWVTGVSKEGGHAPAARPTPARSSQEAPPRLRSPHRSTATPEKARRDVSVSDARGEVGGDDAIVTTEEHAKRYAK